MKAISMKQVKIKDDYWNKYTQLVREVVIPYQWEALNDRIADAAPSYAIRNFRIAAGLEEGEFGGMVFQDSDLAKWLEAVSYSLTTHPDPELEKIADEAIDLIGQAQFEDGYINTFYTVKEPGQRWTNLHECHELYCAGHMIEAAVAYYEATGKRKFLDIMCRFADHIDTIFGPEPDKIQGYDGHQEIELALVKLYQVTGEERYLRLSQFFLDERGQEPNFLIEEWLERGQTSHWVAGKVRPNPEYNQAHLPVREQKVAVGHSVRAVYMYTAMADVALLTGEEELAEACRTLWDNIEKKQMYITGGIGSTHHGEAFTFDYDLPNDTIYAETCASIGLIFFAKRMLQLEPDSRYADVLERALYNNVIGSTSLDGKHYFYVNPLEVWPEASEKDPAKRHVKAERQKWFGCSCCPPNVARLLSSLGEYIYTQEEDTIYTHLFIGNEANFQIGAESIKLKQQVELPWNGQVHIEVSSLTNKRFTLALRIPSWSKGEKAKLFINGAEINYQLEKGYAKIERAWGERDIVEWQLSTSIQLIEARPEIRKNSGKVAIQRGPLVYCLEEIDHGGPISSMTILQDNAWQERFDPTLLGGVIVLEGEALQDDKTSWSDEPYRPIQQLQHPIQLQAIPYNVWGNRGLGEMSVWNRIK